MSRQLRAGWRATKSPGANAYTIVRLGEICDCDVASLPSTTDGEYKFNYVALSDIEKGILLQSRQYKFREAPSRARRKVKQGDVLLATVRPHLQGFYIFREEVRNVVVSTGFCVLTPKVELLYPAYLYQYLYSDQMLKVFEKFNVGTNYPAINSSDIGDFPVPLPPLSEQKAIAGILQKCDEAIEKTEALISAKQKQFEWLLKRLNTPKSDWISFKLGEIGTAYQGLQGKSKADFGRGKPYIPYLNIFQNGRIDPYQLDHVSINQLENQNPVQIGDSFFTTSSETAEDVATSSTLLDDVGECYLNSFCFGYRYDHTKLLPVFAQHLFRSASFRMAVKVLAQGATRFNVSKVHLLQISVMLPPLPKQKRIAHILNTAQREIGLLKQLADRYRTQKRGLMQKLLTGEWRVTG